MHGGRITIVLLCSVLVLVAAGLAVVSVWGQGGTPAFKDVLKLDFSKTADQAKFMANGNASFADKTASVNPPATPRLRLSDAGSQASTAFMTTPIALGKYRALFDFQVQASGSDQPGDGFCFIAQTVGPDKVEGGGGSMGYEGADFQLPNGVNNSGYPNASWFSYAVEFNDWPNNGLSATAPDTIAVDIVGHRERIGQTAIPGNMTGSGVIHAQLDVDPAAGITATLTGGKIPASTPFVWKSPATLNGFFADPNGTDGKPAPMYLGFGAGTGGADCTQEILNFDLQVPA